MRYFIETSYKGTAYSGFQVQQNSNTIQGEIEKALSVYYKQSFSLTGSSRTDAGVHALQNYFHFDSSDLFITGADGSDSGSQIKNAIYHLNAILPRDIVIKRILKMPDEAHCRFDAVSREYHYFVYQQKNPFLGETAYYYPYKIDKKALDGCAAVVKNHADFTSFSKRNTQVKSFFCDIQKSEWRDEGDMFVYTVRSNRFLRGMVKGLVGTMLRAATGKISVREFEEIIISRDCTKADFSVPSHGLFLVEVKFDVV